MSSIAVAAIQTSPVFGEVEANLQTALGLIPKDCDLAVLPELFNTGYQFRNRAEASRYAEPIPAGPTCQGLLEAAASREIHLVGGLVEADGDRLFNSCILARPDRSWERYRKVHLFWDEKDIFDPGDLGFTVHEACGIPIGLMICFDWIYPEVARTLALAGAALLVHPSNLVLPHCPTSMRTRCIENRVFAVTANRVGTEHRTAKALRFIGLSRIIDPQGEVLAGCDEENPGVARAQVTAERTDKQVTPRNNLWEDRRPEFYRL